jgi:hypothetical protein
MLQCQMDGCLPQTSPKETFEEHGAGKISLQFSFSEACSRCLSIAMSTVRRTVPAYLDIESMYTTIDQTIAIRTQIHVDARLLGLNSESNARNNLQTSYD